MLLKPLLNNIKTKQMLIVYGDNKNLIKLTNNSKENIYRNYCQLCVTFTLYCYQTDGWNFCIDCTFCMFHCINITAYTSDNGPVTLNLPPINCVFKRCWFLPIIWNLLPKTYMGVSLEKVGGISHVTLFVTIGQFCL